MEADHSEPATGPQHREGGRQRGLEGAELVVDRDPQRLEHALGGMSLAEAGRRRNGGLDRLDEIACSFERLLLPAPYDRLRDLACIALLAVALEDRGQIPFCGLVDDSGRAHVGTGIHAHVERRVCTGVRFASRSKYTRAQGSRSIAISFPLPCRSAASSDACPPAPKVASTT